MTNIVLSLLRAPVSLLVGRFALFRVVAMQTHFPRILGVVAVCFAVCFAAACADAPPPEPDVEVDRALDAVEVSQKESELFLASLLPLDPATTSPDEAAAAAKDRVGKVFTPADHCTAEVNGNVVTYSLDHCWGPFKSLTLTGVVSAVYSSSTNGLHGYLHADDLLIGKKIRLDIDSEAAYSIDPGTETRRFVVKTRGSGTGSRGNHFAREGAYTLTWDPSTRCATFDGDFTMTTSTRSSHTVVLGWSRCANECPGASGRIVFETSALDYSVTIDFDGTSQASWSSSDGASGKIDLFCGVSP